MNHSDEEMLKFGRMVFGMVTDALLVAGQADASYATRTITLKGNHRCHVFVVKGDPLAEALHETAARICDIVQVPATNPEDRKPQ